MRTHHSSRKRFKITKHKKILRRYSTQDHFNARARGKATRQKRRTLSISPANHKKLKQLLA